MTDLNNFLSNVMGYNVVVLKIDFDPTLTNDFYTFVITMNAHQYILTLKDDDNIDNQDIFDYTVLGQRSVNWDEVIYLLRSKFQLSNLDFTETDKFELKGVN